MRTHTLTGRVVLASAAALVALTAAGCSNDDGGTKLEYTVAGTATDAGTRDTAATADPDAIATAWKEVDGADRPSVPDGQVEVLVSANYQLGQPTVGSVRADGGAWAVHISAYDLKGCNSPAVVTAVTYLLHVTADAPPTTISTATEMKHGCPG